MNGNILAALLGTFFGNPLTYFPIGLISLKVGYFILGRPEGDGDPNSFGATFINAGLDVIRNLAAPFTERNADWDTLAVFYHEVFFPYLIGGLLPGLMAGMLAYLFSLPIVSAYQKRRKGFLKEKLLSLKKKKSNSSTKG